MSTSNLSPGLFLSPNMTSASNMSNVSNSMLISSTPSKVRNPKPVDQIVIVHDQNQSDHDDLGHDYKYEDIAKRFNVPVRHSDLKDIAGSDPMEYITSQGWNSAAFVLNEFSGPIYEALKSSRSTILGPTALTELSTLEHNPILYQTDRPLYSLAMRGMGIYFNGYKQKDKAQLKEMLFKIHSMGGRVLEDIAKVTHLVSKNCKGEKYTYASTFDIPIMQDNWVYKSWDKRREAGFMANNETFQNKWKVKPFHGACIFFLGFSKEEKQHMVDELHRNGGTECHNYKEDYCTHIVVDNNVVETMPDDVRRELHVVKVEWFWASIQMDACAEEKLHLFADYIGAYLSPRQQNTFFSPNGNTTPGSHGRRKKRRTEAVRQLAAQTLDPANSSNIKKARSSVGELSFVLDTPDKNSDIASTFSPGKKEGSPKEKIKSARQMVFSEFVQTEKNYVDILKTIVEVFKEPLEEDPKMQLLNQTQMKIIFGNVPPLLQVHSNMLKDLIICLDNWNENCSIGNIVLKHADGLLKSYPPFVNFFEDTKRTLGECDRNNPRFHAFLKVCQSKPQCGRQTLAELLIRPVQRLGSVSLLLNDLLKHTRKEKDHPDCFALDKALNRIKDVLTNINEDKRKTEGQVHIFEIFSEIEECPPHLVSSHRNFLRKVDVTELGGSDEINGKGCDLTLFLFSDVLEITKRRRNTGKGLGTKSPSTMSLRNTGLVNTAGMNAYNSIRPYKHRKLFNLNSIRRVVDLIDNEDCRDSFALICMNNAEMKEKMFVFQMATEEISKIEFLRMLCRNIANTMYRHDPDIYLKKMLPQDLELTSADFNVTKNYRSLHRVKKVFSFNKTPTSSKLTRAVSSMISPLASVNGRERISSTPSGDLQNLRLQSCSNLLHCDESPRSTRFFNNKNNSSKRTLMGPPPPSPAKQPANQDQDPNSSPTKFFGGFTIPKTPTNSGAICARRASFKFLSNSLGKKY